MVPKELSLEEIERVLESGTFEEFIDVKENEFFEAKPLTWLDFTNNRVTNSKLGKTIASFANQKGGFVVLGLKLYDRTQDIPEDIVQKIEAFGKSSFNTAGLVARLKDVVYPRIEVKVKWYANKENPDIGLVGILVPPQKEGDKFFFARVADLEGEELKGQFWCVPLRVGGATNWISVQTLYDRTKQGPHDIKELGSIISKMFNELKEMIRPQESFIVTTSPDWEDLMKKRIKDGFNEWE